MGRFSYGIEAALARGKRLGLCAFLRHSPEVLGEGAGRFLLV